VASEDFLLLFHFYTLTTFTKLTADQSTFLKIEIPPLGYAAN